MSSPPRPKIAPRPLDPIEQTVKHAVLQRWSGREVLAELRRQGHAIRTQDFYRLWRREAARRTRRPR